MIAKKELKKDDIGQIPTAPLLLCINYMTVLMKCQQKNQILQDLINFHAKLVFSRLFLWKFTK
jgi:hypothetical protein